MRNYASILLFDATKVSKAIGGDRMTPRARGRMTERQLIVTVCVVVFVLVYLLWTR
jgi:hypothetical protein